MKLVNIGIGRGNSYVAVVRVNAVGVGCADRCEGKSRLLAELTHTLCTAVHNKQADEISAVRLLPACNSRAVKCLFESVCNGVEFRLEDCRLLLHMCLYAVKIFEISCVSELIYLVV